MASLCVVGVVSVDVEVLLLRIFSDVELVTSLCVEVYPGSVSLRYAAASTMDKNCVNMAVSTLGLLLPIQTVSVKALFTAEGLLLFNTNYDMRINNKHNARRLLENI